MGQLQASSVGQGRAPVTSGVRGCSGFRDVLRMVLPGWQLTGHGPPGLSRASVAPKLGTLWCLLGVLFGVSSSSGFSLTPGQHDGRCPAVLQLGLCLAEPTPLDRGNASLCPPLLGASALLCVWCPSRRPRGRLCGGPVLLHCNGQGCPQEVRVRDPRRWLTKPSGPSVAPGEPEVVLTWSWLERGAGHGSAPHLGCSLLVVEGLPGCSPVLVWWPGILTPEEAFHVQLGKVCRISMLREVAAFNLIKFLHILGYSVTQPPSFA